MQAARILEAWMRQDKDALRTEFQRGLSICNERPEALAVEEEHVELLKGVISKLEGADPSDPVVRLCLSLLVHLAAQGDQAPACYKGDVIRELT
jgi:hypothetical protein